MNEIEKAEERYQKFIRKFTTCDLLEYFSKISIESYQNNEKGITTVDVPFYNKKTGGKGIIKGFGYGQWELVQICYSSIKYSNDYRGDKVDESSFYHLISENRIYQQKIENIKETDNIKVFEHLQCLTNIQFDYQVLDLFNQFNRMYQIMVCINKDSNYNQTKEVCYINFENKFEEITEIGLNKFINIYLLLILFSTVRVNANMFDIIKDIQFDTQKLGFSKDDMIKVISLMSRDYNFYRQSDNWNSLRFYPIVRTDKDNNKFIISNIYSLLLSLPNTIYWTIRNYYHDINSSEFMIYFGKCFEYYLEELLNYYNIKHEKLKESKKQGVKMPDWKIETEKFIFLVEQKSALFPIATRTSDKVERYSKIENYFNNTIIKAFEQLNAYEIKGINKKVIRICLPFETIYMEENVKYIIEKKMKFKYDRNLNWIVNIDEFEILMDILSNDEDEFNRIVEEKIHLEVKQDNNGRSLEKILSGCKNNYLNKKINHFKRITEEMLERLK